MDQVAVPMFLVGVAPGPDFSILHLNPAHEARSGMSCAAVAGRRLHDILPPRLADTVAENYRQAWQSRAPHRYEELLDLPGGRLWWDTTLSPLPDAEGNVVALIGTAIDITDHKARNFQAAEQLARAERMNRDIATFAAMAAHDIRGPLHNIEALIGLIQEDFKDLGDDKSELIAQCGTIARVTRDQISEMLSYASALDPLVTDNAEFDLHHICADIAAILDPEGRLALEFPRVRLQGDRVIYQMVLRNMIDNAVKHATSRVLVMLDAAGDGLVRLRVADDGPGVDAATLAVVQDDRKMITTHGYGIAAVRYIAEGRGGSFRFGAPVFETGATAEVVLPGTLAPAIAA